jgi:hypothetical protein
MRSEVALIDWTEIQDRGRMKVRLQNYEVEIWPHSGVFIRDLSRDTYDATAVQVSQSVERGGAFFIYKDDFVQITGQDLLHEGRTEIKLTPRIRAVYALSPSPTAVLLLL